MNKSSDRYEKIEREFEDLEIGSSHNAAWEWRIWVVYIWLQLPIYVNKVTQCNSYVQVLCGYAETFGLFHLKLEASTDLILNTFVKFRGIRLNKNVVPKSKTSF